METLTFLLTSTFYPPYHLGGDAVHVKYLADELVKRGHEVHVLHSLDAYNIKRKVIPKKGNSNSIHTHTIKTKFNLSSYASYIFGKSSPVDKTFESLVKELKPDVVHHHNISLLGYNLLKKQGNYINLYTAHDYWLICQKNDLLKNHSICRSDSCFSCALSHHKVPQLWRYKNSFLRAIADLDAVIVPSTYIKNQISPYINNNIQLIPNFVPETNLHESAKLVEDNIPQFSDFFLFAGVLEENKGIIDLIKAYKEVSDQTSTRLLIAGQGSLKKTLQNFIINNNLTNKVILLGWVDHASLYPLLESAKALIMPSALENCPLIVLEALSVGTPVIAANNGGLPEIIRKIDKTLIYADSAELKRIMLNFERRNLDQRSIKKIFNNNYSAQAFINRYFDIISHLIE